MYWQHDKYGCTRYSWAKSISLSTRVTGAVFPEQDSQAELNPFQASLNSVFLHLDWLLIKPIEPNLAWGDGIYIFPKDISMLMNLTGIQSVLLSISTLGLHQQKDKIKQFPKCLTIVTGHLQLFGALKTKLVPTLSQCT